MSHVQEGEGVQAAPEVVMVQAAPEVMVQAAPATHETASPAELQELFALINEEHARMQARTAAMTAQLQAFEHVVAQSSDRVLNSLDGVRQRLEHVLDQRTDHVLNSLDDLEHRLERIGQDFEQVAEQVLAQFPEEPAE